MCIRDRSMPGMMDTILNLGLNDEAVEGLAKKTGNARFAYDCYRRFVQMFADVVMMVPKSLFEVEIDKMKEAKGVKNDEMCIRDRVSALVVMVALRKDFTLLASCSEPASCAAC